MGLVPSEISQKEDKPFLNLLSKGKLDPPFKDSGSAHFTLTCTWTNYE